MNASAPPNECPTRLPFNQGSEKRKKKNTKIGTCNYDGIVRESEQLTTHDVYHHGAHRAVQDEEVGINRCRIVILDPTRL
jgi:hypothetical protein